MEVDAIEEPPVPTSTVTGLDGYDPLDEHLDASNAHLRLIQDSTRRIVQNILKSYTGYFDVFNESIQNALDAVDLKARQSHFGYNPKIHILIDIPRRIVRVTDNGSGMDQEQFRLCFRPNTSFKNRRESRGSKGVGATFLAYGFSMIKLQTKQGEIKTSAVLRGGRDWAEERTTIRPRLSVVEFDAVELLHETSGTSVEILIADSQRPRLSWLGAKSAESWYEVLRIRSPLGGVYLTKGVKENIVEPEVHIQVISVDGTKSDIIKARAEYYYPHEMPIFDATKVKTIGDIVEMEGQLPGNVKAKVARIPESFRRLEAIWEIWDEEDLTTHPVLSKELNDEQKTLLQQHRTKMYGFFISSARLWSDFQSRVLNVNAGAKLLEGGLQLASDHMVQGDLNVIPLTSAAGYHRHAHIVVHYTDGNPDMGRKVFQPELKEVAEELARRAVDVFRSYREYMKGDSGAPPQRQQDRHFDWIVAQKERRDTSPLIFEYEGNRLPIITVPNEEQEVISLFNQLLGCGAIKGINIISLSLDTQYDGSYVSHYPSDSLRYVSATCPLGVGTDNIHPDPSKPMTLEFKYNLDGLVSDFDNNVKYPLDIDTVVVWDLGSYYKTALELTSLLSSAGSERRFYGATHRAKTAGGDAFEVVCLRDLIRVFQDRGRVEAEHRISFGL